VQSTQATFRMDSAYERAFCAEYLPGAWDRLHAHDGVDSAWFWRFGNVVDREPVELAGGAVTDGGGVILVVNGDDPDAALAAERDRWDELAATPRLDRVETKQFSEGGYESAREKMVDSFGPVGGERLFRLRPTACETTLATLTAFDEQLPAVPEPTEEDPSGIGVWSLLHLVCKQHGLDWDDEIDACGKAIENRAASLAAFYDEATAREALDEAIAELEATRDSLGGSSAGG